MTQTITPLAFCGPSSSAPAPLPPPLTQMPANDRPSGTQREDDLCLIEKQIISPPWWAANALEPLSGSTDCHYLADCYGIRSMSCHAAFVVPNPDGTFECWGKECSCVRTTTTRGRGQAPAYRSFQPQAVCVCPNERYCLVSPASPCIGRGFRVPTVSCSAKRFFSSKDLQNHRRRCH